MKGFSPKVRSLKAKILQVQNLSKFKFSQIFFWNTLEILFAIGNGIKRGDQIDKNVPRRLRTLRIIDIFQNLWAAHTEAGLNLENILNGYGGCFSRFLFGVQGLNGGSIGHFISVKSSFDPECRFSFFAPCYRNALSVIYRSQKYFVGFMHFMWVYTSAVSNPSNPDLNRLW